MFAACCRYQEHCDSQDWRKLYRTLKRCRERMNTNWHCNHLHGLGTQPDDVDWVQDAILKICEIMNHIVTNNQSESQAQDP